MPFMIQQRQLITSISVGIVVSPRDGIDGLKLMNYISQGAQMFSNKRKFLKRRKAGATTAKTEAVKRKGSYTIITREMESMSIKCIEAIETPIISEPVQKAVKCQNPPADNI